VERILRPARLAGTEVDRLQTEATGEPEDGLMIGVDQLSAPLADLAVAPVPGRVRMDPTSGLIRRLVHRGGDPRVVKGQRCAQAGEPRPDDGDRCLGLSRRCLWRGGPRRSGLEAIAAEGQPRGRHATAQEDGAPRHRWGRARRGHVPSLALTSPVPLGPDHGGRDASEAGGKLDHGEAAHDASVQASCSRVEPPVRSPSSREDSPLSADCSAAS
jgi:hypothetical protein